MLITPQDAVSRTGVEMARRETVVFSCDLHDGDMTDDVETVSFGLDGQAYEVDACEEHRQQLQDAFAPYVGAARKAGGSGGSGARRPARSAGRTASTGGADREEVQRIREWARDNGHKVSERGRLSSSVLEAYRSAH
jgi:hypothetical protein